MSALVGMRGAVMPAALVIVAIAGAVSAAVATLARTEVVLARNREAAARALAAADTCLAAVIAALPAGWDFEAVLTGPDGVAGTADDGERAAPVGCVARLRLPPGSLLPPRALLDVEAVSAPAQRRLEAVIARSPSPGVPALVWLAHAASLADVTGTLTFETADVADPGAPPLAPLAAPDDPAVLDAWLAAGSGRVSVSPGAAVPLRVPPPPLVELSARMRDAGAVPGGTLVAAGVPPLALTLVGGDLSAPSTARGRGILFVDGLLDIPGTFEFSGVVVASGGIRVAAGARLDVAGIVWLGAAGTLVAEGDVRVAASADALEAADDLLGLPRLARVSGLRDPP